MRQRVFGLARHRYVLRQDSGITGKTAPLAPPSDERDGEHQAAGAESDGKANRVADDAFHDFSSC